MGRVSDIRGSRALSLLLLRKEVLLEVIHRDTKDQQKERNPGASPLIPFQESSRRKRVKKRLPTSSILEEDFPSHGDSSRASGKTSVRSRSKGLTLIPMLLR